MSQLFLKFIFTLFVFSFLTQSVLAVKIVRLEMEYGSDDLIATGGFDTPKTNKIIDLELFEDVTPITVANFLRYVNGGLYNNIFIHRSVSDFILQTGGFNNISFDPENEPLGDSLGAVETFPSILNEPGISNIRGTVAMAKLGGQPDSANSQWFINLDDNSFLDSDSGGLFTVFGSVIDDGMEVADQIATFPVLDATSLFGSQYSDLPLADFANTFNEALFQSNLIMILRATEVSRPILRFTPAASDFGIDLSSDTVGKSIDVVLTNTGNEALKVEAINASDLSAPFSIQSDGCSGVSLEPSSGDAESSCTLSLQFKATATGIFSDLLTVDYTSKTSDDAFAVTYTFSGEGSDVGIPEIATVSAFDVGTSQVAGFEMTRELKINNIGQDSLQIIEITGLSDTGFSQNNDCIDSAELIAPGDFCTILIGFEASDFGVETAVLSIESSDPINTTIDIDLSGNGDSDSDGVVTALENAAPNGGDANFDGVVDSQQNTVASFATESGEYLTLVVGNRDIVTRISVTPGEDSELPEGVSVKYGILEYDVIVRNLDPINVGLVLPAGDVPNAFYLFGETLDNEVPHWYQYPVTQILPNVALSSSTRNLVQITVQDGGLGDSDQRVNGRIHIGPSVVSFASSSGSSGSINIIFLAFYLAILIFIFRRRSKQIDLGAIE